MCASGRAAGRGLRAEAARETALPTRSRHAAHLVSVPLLSEAPGRRPERSWLRCDAESTRVRAATDGEAPFHEDDLVDLPSRGRVMGCCQCREGSLRSQRMGRERCIGESGLRRLQRRRLASGRGDARMSSFLTSAFTPGPLNLPAFLAVRATCTGGCHGCNQLPPGGRVCGRRRASAQLLAAPAGLRFQLQSPALPLRPAVVFTCRSGRVCNLLPRRLAEGSPARGVFSTAVSSVCLGAGLTPRCLQRRPAAKCVVQATCLSTWGGVGRGQCARGQ